MTLSSRFFADGSYYGQSDLAKLVRDALPLGYVSGVGSELSVNAPGGNMQVYVGTGRGYINGYMFDVEDAPYTITLDTASPSYPRIDRIVARLSIDSAKSIILTAKKGTPASEPQPPALTRSGDIWEISLATVLVPKATSVLVPENVTDERNNYDVCGIANEQKVNAARLTGTISGDRLPVVPHDKLPPASKTEMGGLIVGNGITVDTNGVVSIDPAKWALVSDDYTGYAYYLKFTKNSGTKTVKQSFVGLNKVAVEGPFSISITCHSAMSTTAFTARIFAASDQHGSEIAWLWTHVKGFTITDDTTGTVLYSDDTEYKADVPEEDESYYIDIPMPDDIVFVDGHTYTMKFAEGTIFRRTTYGAFQDTGLYMTMSYTGTVTNDMYLVTNGV